MSVVDLLYQWVFSSESLWWLRDLPLFLEQGGPVLLALASVVLLFWLLTFERIAFLLISFPSLKKQWHKKWLARTDHESWYATSLRDAWLSEASLSLKRNLSLMKLLVAVCPMLGLLGTVTGMISVFDIMAQQGSSDPKLMASGISMATLPTMAGMVAALAGMFAHARVVKACQKKEQALEKLLRGQS